MFGNLTNLQDVAINNVNWQNNAADRNSTLRNIHVVAITIGYNK